MNDVAAIVVTYNRKVILQQCLDKLQNQTIPLDIIVVDNASTDGTEELFKTHATNIFYYNTGSNLGGAGGFNFGVRKGVEAGYRYLWLMDDDTFPTPTALKNLLSADEQFSGNYGFLSSKVNWKDTGKTCRMNWQKVTKWRYVKNFDRLQRIQYASFVSCFIRAEIVKSVGLPYKEFFVWADDWEYTRRISKTYESYYIPFSIVEHWSNSNVGADIIKADLNRLDRFKYMYRNDVCLYRLDGVEGAFYLFVRTILHLTRIIFKATDKQKKVVLMFRALRVGLKFYPEVEYIDE